MIETDTSLGSGIKIKCSRESLVETVALVARAVSSRTSVQVLAGILITAEKGRLRLAATDMELSISSSLEAEVGEEGASVVPGRVFVDACRSLPTSESEVTIEQASGSRMLNLICGAASYRLNVSTPEDFPRLVEMKDERVVKVDRAAFLETTGRVARAASRDESRPVLTGILIRFDQGTSSSTRKLTVAASDSYRFAVKETELEFEECSPQAKPASAKVEGDSPSAGGEGAETGNETPELEAIVPARSIAELARVPASGGELQLSIQDNHVIFVLGDATVSTRRIDGQFPPPSKYLPESFLHTIKVERTEFLDAVRRVSVMAQRTSPIKLNFEEGALTVSAQTQDVGEASETLAVAFKGEPLQIGFKAEFLREGVESVLGDELELNLNSPIQPGLLRAEGDSFWYLIMPIRLAG